MVIKATAKSEVATTSRVRRFFGIALLVVTLGFVASLTQSDTTYAVVCTYDRYSCNSDEARAKFACINGVAKWAEGAIWFNNTGSSNTDTGYYAIGVNVPANATSVTVNIRGSVNSCQDVSNGSGVWAVNVSRDTVGGAFPESNRLSNFSSTTLFRGNYNWGWHRWTTQGGTIQATLDVSGLATNNVDGANTQTINVGLYRCYSGNGSTVTGSCGTAIIPVVVTRAQEPKFTLNPIVSTDRDSGSVGEPVTASPSVVSTGDPGAVATNAQWQLSRFVVPRTGSYPTTIGYNDRTPLQHYGNGLTPVGAGNTSFGIGSTPLADFNQNIADLSVGTRVCYALSVRPYTNNNTLNYWAHGEPKCVVVAKKPKVQVRGGDLVVGRGILGTTASPNVIAGTTLLGSTPAGAAGPLFGSWSEYGLVAKGRVSGMASGSGYVNGATSTSLCDVSLLTFNNKPTATSTGCPANSVGNYTIGSTTPRTIASKYPAASATQSLTGTINVSARQGFYNTTGSIELIGTTINPGRWIIINAGNNDVTIRGNILYGNGPITQAINIPQLVVIARNIIIADSVTQVDAWLFASGSGTEGRLNTCAVQSGGTFNQTAEPRADVCASPLTVNGPVAANHLLLRRTNGAGTGIDAGDPAEIFNLRPDAYLWATAVNSEAGRLPTINTTELPPRY